MSGRKHSAADAIATLALHPGKDYVETAEIKALGERALSYLRAGFPLHLRGPAGTGKTTLAFRLAAALNRPAMLIEGDESLTTGDLIGRQTRIHHKKVVDRFIHSVTKYEENVNQEWSDSRLTVACREGYTLIYDEFTRSRPEANNVLLAVLEEKLLTLPSGGGGEYVPVHPDFRVIFTSNPKEYAGVHAAQDALNDRMITLDIDYFDEAAETSIAAARSGLPEEMAAPVVKLVRSYRASGEFRQIPTPRASIAITRMMAAQDLKPSSNDPRFVQLCLDILDGKCGYADSALPARLMELISEHCSEDPIPEQCAEDPISEHSAEDPISEHSAKDPIPEHCSEKAEGDTAAKARPASAKLNGSAHGAFNTLGEAHP